LNSHIGLEGQGNPIEIRLIKKNYNVQFPTNLMWNDEIKKKKLKQWHIKTPAKLGKSTETHDPELCKQGNLIEGKTGKIMKLDSWINLILNDKTKKNINFLKITLNKL
jgi:hypothetical protein